MASAPFSAMPDQLSAPISAGTTPRPGFRVTRPQAAAGSRSEPMPSLPCASGTDPEATAAALPPELPAGDRAVSHGLRRDRPRAVGRRVEAELGCARDADDDRAGLAEPGDHGMVLRLRGPRAGRRTVGADLAGDGHVVLDRDRHTRERQGEARERGVDRVRLGQRRLPPDHPEGADPGVDRVDVIEVRADDVDRGHLARPDESRDLEGRQPDDPGNVMRARDSSASVHGWTVTATADTFRSESWMSASPYTGDVEAGGPADVRELPGLTISKLAVSEMANNAYLLRDTTSGEALLIDAAADPDALRALIGDADLRTVVTTHGHWDHHRALPDVVEATGAVTVAHAADAPTCPSPSSGRSGTATP